jgi:hypothetical protein
LTTLHYASGHNLDAQGNFTPAQAGFNLADVSSVAQLNALPDGVMGLVWLDQGDGVTQEFIDQVTPFIGNPKLYGFFLKDEPDTTGNWGPLVTAEDLKAESDWIHANVPGAKTFITMMNMGTAANPTYANTYTPENTHIDLFGITGYPARSESSTVDYNMIDRNVAAAQAAGIPVDSIVPVYQTFGGGNWVTEGGGHYLMPTAAQMQEMFDHWDALVPTPAFDYAYAWGSQNGDVALESSAGLQSAFLQHNTSDGAGVTPPPVVEPDIPPVVDTGGSAPPDDVDTGGSTPPVVDAGGGTSPGGGSSGGTTTDPAPVEPTPVSHGGAGWHSGPNSGFGQGNGVGHGLDFSKLLEGGSPPSFTPPISPQPGSDGGGLSWGGWEQAGGDAGFSSHGPGGGQEAHTTTEANTGANFGPNWSLAQSSLLDAAGKHGMHHDQQSWHW